METAIDKLKENIQSSIRNTENLIKDLDKKLSKYNPFGPTWFSYFHQKSRVVNKLQILQELNDALK